VPIWAGRESWHIEIVIENSDNLAGRVMLKAALRMLLGQLKRKGASAPWPDSISQQPGSRQPTLEVHVPISPTTTMFNMLRCLTHSLRRHGGAYRDAPVIATVGDGVVGPEIESSLNWLSPNGIELRWVPRDTFARYSYAATVFQRFEYQHQSDVVLVLDADTLISRPIDNLVESVHREQVIAGLIAHASPFEGLGLRNAWRELHAGLGIQNVRMDHQHGGWGTLYKDAGFRYCPPYFNFGVICAPSTHFGAMSGVCIELLNYVRDRFKDFYYDCQVTVSLAIAKLGLPYRCLPMRYNFPNHRVLEEQYAHELPAARILHLLGDHQEVRKMHIFASSSNLAGFVNRIGLKGINRTAQAVIKECLPKMQEEDGAAADAGIRAA
jgi:hypothetical protein